jgi:1-acyl-sn-glycerol-3-phosphate acyltransferase
MNLQPYKTPPCWWSPCHSSPWIAFWRPFRRYRAKLEHGLVGADIQGTEYIREAMAAGQGVLITPNHPSHADPFALLEVADQMRLPFHFMTAWQVFASTHWLGRRVLRQHGAFSVNREGHDLRAYRQAVTLLQQPQPLVIFPEGEVFHLNDRVMHFRRGAATAAIRAANRSGRPVACIPCGIHYRCLGDPRPHLSTAMARLEQQVGLTPSSEMPLVNRIMRLSAAVLRLKEREYFGCVKRGSLDERTRDLIAALLGRLEIAYHVTSPRGTIPERVKELRRRAIARQEAVNSSQSSEQGQHDLDDLFFVMQLFSYPTDYLGSSPSLERLVETVDKLEEDILRLNRANLRTNRKAVITFGAPVVVPTDAARLAAEDLTATLQSRVQTLLDEMDRSPLRKPADEAPALPSLPDWNPLPQAA